MGTIAFPNIAQDSERIAEQNSLQEYARAAQEKQAANLISQQAQGVQLENQKQQLQLQDQQAMTAAMKQWDGKDIGSLPDLMRQNGISAGGYLNAQQTILARKQALTQLDSTQLSNLQSHHDAALGVLNAAEQVPDEQLMQHMTDSAQQLQAQGHLQPQEAQQIIQHAQSMPPDQFRPWIDIYKKGLMGEKEQIAQVQSGAEAEQNSAKAREENATAAHQEFINSLTKNSKPTDYYQQIDAILDPNNPATGGQNRMVKAQVDGAISRGDVEGAKQFVDQAFQNVQGINKEIAVNTNPAVQAAKLHLATAEKAAEQAIADGDPKAAAKLLIDGTVAPSQIISSRKPAFAQQAFTTAEQMQPGWSATRADADFKVASSPQNVGFFGSAKSLTDKGGTLDQLAAAGKDIPADQFPVFNTVADAIKASTGTGPIAKYAAVALGVADDYSKVMGGGQGSDTSRTQALNLISAKESPEARAASIEGIRGAVASQTNSRIGNNAVLKKMYGGSVAQGGETAPVPGFSVKAPNGKTYSFKDQASADLFKQRAGIQ